MNEKLFALDEIGQVVVNPKYFPFIEDIESSRSFIFLAFLWMDRRVEISYIRENAKKSVVCNAFSYNDPQEQPPDLRNITTNEEKFPESKYREVQRSLVAGGIWRSVSQMEMAIISHVDHVIGLKDDIRTHWIIINGGRAIDQRLDACHKIILKELPDNQKKKHSRK